MTSDTCVLCVTISGGTRECSNNCFASFSSWRGDCNRHGNFVNEHGILCVVSICQVRKTSHAAMLLLLEHSLISKGV